MIQEDLKQWAEITGAKAGDMIFVLSGPADKTRTQLSALRMELATRLGLRNPSEFAPLWVVDFPLLELDEEIGRWHAMHHPFTSPKPEDMELLATNPGKSSNMQKGFSAVTSNRGWCRTNGTAGLLSELSR